MARFFFDGIIGKSLSRDEIGLDLADGRAARAHALAGLSDLVREEIAHASTGFAILVRDEAGSEIYKARLTFSEQIVEGEPDDSPSAIRKH